MTTTDFRILGPDPRTTQFRSEVYAPHLKQGYRFARNCSVAEEQRTVAEYEAAGFDVVVDKGAVHDDCREDPTMRAILIKERPLSS